MNLQAIAIDRGNGYAQLVEEFPALTDFRPAWLGDYHRLVVTGQQGVYFARQIDGQIITAVNDLLIAPMPDMPVIVGREKTAAGAWHIVRAREEYL